tara:strand:- start:261 stop:821 length:561 start_codon:yes stop_codon:yes gene_type:complete
MTSICKACKSKKNDVIMYQSCITRFNNKTWEENCMWRERNNLAGGCIYNTTVPMPVSVNKVPFIFMIEMNITTKSIIGVGLLKNQQELKRNFVYSENKYNLYSYKGKYHIDKEEFTEDEILLIEDLEVVLFTGYCHMIRGIGISKLPNKLIHKIGKNENRIETEYPNKYNEMFLKTFRRKYGKIYS